MLRDYESHHKNTYNLVCHVLGIPLILVSLFLFYLAPKLGLIFFVLGWMFQIIGHIFEGERPAFLTQSKHLITGVVWYSAQLIKPQRWFLGVLAWLTLVTSLMTVRLALMGRQSANIKIENSDQSNQLRACPDTPNCALVRLDKKEYPNASLSSVNKVLQDMGGNVLNPDSNTNYLHAEFKTTIFAFTDDFEVLLDESGLQVRSASRVGHSDLGANRKRIERFKQLISTSP